MNKYLVTAALLALASGTASATPTLGEGSLAPSERVRFADLDLDSQAGLDTLKSRIRAAANNVCAPDEIQPIGERIKGKSCYRTAVSNAYRQVDRRAAKRSTGG